MGFNIHILSGRRPSQNLDVRAALAASFNPARFSQSRSRFRRKTRLSRASSSGSPSPQAHSPARICPCRHIRRRARNSYLLSTPSQYEDVRHLPALRGVTRRHWRRLGVEKHYTRFQDVLSDPVIDFLHINTRLGTHGARPSATCRARAPMDQDGAPVAASHTRTVLSANAVTTKSIRPHLKSLRFGDICVHGLNQTENLLKAHC